MKKNFRYVLAGVLVSCLASMSALAQSSDFDRLGRDNGPEARVTLTIPIGPKSQSAKDKSRLEFGIRQYTDRSSDSNWALNPNARIYAPEYNESRIGLTLDKNAALMLNGHEWTEMNKQLSIDREDVGTGLGTAAIVVTVAAVALVGSLIIACQDGCYGDEEY